MHDGKPLDSGATDAIRAEAHRLGFDRVGFASLAPPEEARHLPEWLEAGYHGEMGYLARNPEARADAERDHPWARTMICLARAYAQPSPRAAPLEGQVSIYALGPDYHDTIRRDLKELARFLGETFAARTRLAVDTSPILERPYARNAGLGWVGKNTLLLSRELGSYFFLAEIVTDLEIELSGSFTENHCGQCTSCLDLCPTRAFVQPYVLDSRRCISYLTIEHRGVIPRELRPLMGNWIFGCDICQEVCPWNRFARPVTGEDFAPRADLSPAVLASFVGMSQEEFRARFRKSPVYRAHRDGFLRNVVIALGNSGSPGAIPPLLRALDDPSWLVRLHAAWAISRLRTLDRRAEEALRQLRHDEEHPEVLAEIDRALCYDESAPEGRDA